MSENEFVSDKQIAELMSPSRPQGITPEFIRTAKQCDFKWVSSDGGTCGLHECSHVLGEPHTHTCIDCYTEYE